MSEACFVETFALLAMLNPSDTRHREAMDWFNASHRPLVITEWVLTELADGLSAARTRGTAVTIKRRLRADARVTIVESSADLFRRGLELYTDRPDMRHALLSGHFMFSPA